MTSWGQMIITIDIYVQNDPENIVARHACDLFLVTLCDLTGTFSSMSFVLVQYLS